MQPESDGSIPEMMLNTIYEEDVSGEVIGICMVVADLRYDGRKQGSTIYAATEDEAKQVAEDRKNNIISRCGEAALSIFPLDAWEIRIRA